MNFLRKVILSPLFWTIPIYIAIICFMPPFYQKFNLELVRAENNTDKKIFYEDLDSDGYSEKIISENKFNFHSFIFKNEKDSVAAFFNIKNSTTDNELCKFEDYNQNGILEFYFLTISNDSIFLNAIEYQSIPKYIFKHEFITTIDRNHKGEYDISTNENPEAFDINNDGYKEIFFYISAGYSYYPRKVFAYDIVNDTVYSSPESGAKLMSPNFYDFNNDNSPEIYFTSYATDNYDSLTDKSNYPDTSAWLMILDENLKFLFKPIEFTPRGTKIQPFPIKNINTNNFDVFVLKTSFINSHTPTVAYIYNIKGELINEKELVEISNKNVSLIDYRIKSSKISFIDELGYLYVYNYDLSLEKKQKVIELNNSEHVSVGMYDINSDGEVEYLFWHQSGVTVTDKNFKNSVSVPLENSGLEFPSIIKQLNGDTYFWYKTVNNTWYKLKYSKNPKYYFRYFIFIGIFIIVFIVIYLLMTLRTRKLKADNKKLNSIVEERTHEIKIQVANLDILNQKLYASSLKIDKQNINLKKQNKKIKIQTKDLKNKNSQLIQLTEFKENLMSMIVHDLKNPLYIISKTSSEKNIKLKANQIIMLVENILDIQKLKINKIQINFTEVNLFKTINKVFNEIELLIKQKNINFENNINPSLYANTDTKLLERILINLLTNAIKYSPNNGEIIVHSELLSGNDIKITVSDNGKGIKPQNLKNIFDKYQQYDAKNYGKIKSTGLGLSFCKLAVESMGGIIGVISELGKGSDFYFTVKQSQTSNEIEKSQNTQKQNNKKLNLSKKDKIILAPFLVRLQETEIYEVTKIKKILNKINSETNPNITNWLTQLENTIYSSNEEMYRKLINI